MPSLRVPLALALAAAPGLAQRTWVVDKAGGPGSNFTEIQPAMDAAQPGDTVLVLGASTVVYSSFVVRKAIVVEAVSGATSGWITVAGVTAGTAARVTGFQVQGSGGLLGGPALSVVACPGAVHVSGLTVTSAVTSYSLVSVDGSPSVLMTDCSVVTNLPGGPLVPAMSAQRSGVVMQRCSVVGYMGGGPALTVANATVVIADCAITGGAGYTSPTPTVCSGDGGPALWNGDCLVLGASKISGGPGGAVKTGCPVPKQGVAADGVIGTILIAADATVSGLLGSRARVVRSLGWIESPGTAVLGAPTTVKLRGSPFTGFLLHLDLGFGVTPVPPLETPYLGTTGAVYLAPFVLGAAGTLPFTFTLPMLPGLPRKTLHLHALALEPGTNAVSFTNLGDLLLR